MHNASDNKLWPHYCNNNIELKNGRNGKIEDAIANAWSFCTIERKRRTEFQRPMTKQKTKIFAQFSLQIYR